MTSPYGPWATAIDAGRNPQLSSFWRQRLTMLVPASQTNPALTRTAACALIAAALLVGTLPLLRGQVAPAEPARPAAEVPLPSGAPGNQSQNGSDFQKGVSASFSAMVPGVFAEVRFFEPPPEKRKNEEGEEITRRYRAAIDAFRDQVHAHWPYSGEEYRKQQQAYADAEREVNSLFSQAKGGAIDRDDAVRRMLQIAKAFPDSPLSDHALDHGGHAYWDVNPRRNDEGWKLTEAAANSTAPLSAFRIFAMTNVASRPRDAGERLRTREQFAAKMRQWHDPGVLAPLLLNPLPMESEDRYLNRVQGTLRNIESQYLLNAENMKADAAISARLKAAADAATRPPSNDAAQPLLAEFRRTYALPDDKVIKRVGPPFSPGRLAFYRVHDEQAKAAPGGPDYMWFKWDQPRPDPLPPNWPRYHEGRLSQGGMGWAGGKGAALAALIESWTGIHSSEMQGDQTLKHTRIPGDWVVRDGTAAEKLLQGLETVLRDECHVPVRFRLGERDRQVIVVEGTYAFRPLPGRSTIAADYSYEGNELKNYDQLEIEAHDGSGSSSGRSGSLQELLSFLTIYLDRPVIGEEIRLPADMASGKSAQREHLLQWWLSENPMLHDEALAKGSFDETAVLKRLSEQTGMTFSEKTRRVRVLLVERVEK